MPDVFISYSRQDSAPALQLCERLRAEGLAVWIDQHAIDAADLWATTIAEGIRSCTTFLLLLSAHSVESESVLKELSLASEKRKRIVAVELSETTIPSSFEYSLAGIQRLAFSDFEAILRAHNLGSPRVPLADLRKSLIVMPFDDLSPKQDNAWFADGLVSEMIDSLSHIKSLRLVDRRSSMELRGCRRKLREVADALNVRYFIQGNVQKFGQKIKISVSLLDIESGNYLWQDSRKGQFKDIFDIQEAVAEKVVVGLQLHLTNNEREKLLERGTENSEAYELYIKAGEFFHRQTRDGLHYTIKLLSDAIHLDPGFAQAYQSKSAALVMLYRNYEHVLANLVEAEALVIEALRLKPDLWISYLPLSIIYQSQGKLKEAKMTAERYIECAPDIYSSHAALGFFYGNTGQFAEAIAPYEKAVRIKPDNLPTLWNLVAACEAAADLEKLTYWASFCIPYFENHLRLQPDNEGWRVSYALLLHFAGRTDESREAAKGLSDIRDGNLLYNIAILWWKLEELGIALDIFQKVIEAGYRNANALKAFLHGPLRSLENTTEYEEARIMIERIEASRLDT